MPVILSLETSTEVCSVALHDGKMLVSKAETHQPQSHAAQLALLIQTVVGKAGVTMKQIDAVAISAGPGSYTGLRIGTSTAKGLCYALDIPLIAVGSLELLGFQGNRHNPFGDLLCPMIDARRMEVYCLVMDSHFEIFQPVSARIIDESSFSELLEGHKMLFFGNGSVKCRNVIRHSNAAFIKGIYPEASALGLMAERKFIAKEFEDLPNFKPFYLKEFIAKKRGGAAGAVHGSL